MIEHGLDQINAETFGLFEINRGREPKLPSGEFDADERRTRLIERGTRLPAETTRLPVTCASAPAANAAASSLRISLE